MAATNILLRPIVRLLSNTSYVLRNELSDKYNSIKYGLIENLPLSDKLPIFYNKKYI